MSKSESFEKVLREANDTILELGRKIVEDFKSLNSILFELQENFDDERSRLREMSLETDSKIKKIVDRIGFNVKKLGNCILEETRVTPIDKGEMDNVMIGIMLQYATTSACIKLDALIEETYAKELNEIHSSLNQLSTALNDYNLLAVEKNWPKLLTENEALIEAKKLMP